MKKIIEKLRGKSLKLPVRKGAYLPVILMASTLFLAYSVAIVTISLANIKTARIHNSKITSMAIAEAGINYYMWHLSHDPSDYCDGMTCPAESPYGPFTHDYKSDYGDTLGTYDLFITPPDEGGSTVVVKSVGKVDGENPTRTIVAELGIPSFTKFTLMVNGSQLWVGDGEKITGTVHVNGSGMYNEGEITDDASSTEVEYNGWFGLQPGVAGPGIFGGAKLYPVPQVDFNQVDVDILTLRNNARDLGEGDYYASSGRRGYHIVLNTDNYDVYVVRRYNSYGHYITRENFQGNYSYPSEGIIFFEDNLWIEGKISDQQITLIAADPEANQSQMKRMVVTNPIEYTYYDGTDKIGMITQTDILLARNAPHDMEIDAAMIAKEGEVKINYYPGEIKGNIRVWGSIAHTTGLVWTYATTGGTILSGYATTETVMDTNNVINPPPQFPTTGAYSILSWREE